MSAESRPIPRSARIAHRRAAALSVAALAVPSVGRAATPDTFTGTASATWNNVGNWSTAIPDKAYTYDVYFNSSSAILSTTLDSSYNVASLVVTNPAGNVAVARGTAGSLLTIGAGGIDLSAAAAGTANLSIGATTAAAMAGIGASQTWNVGSGHSLTISSPSNTTFNLGGYTLTTVGTVTMAGANLSNGTIDVHGGTLQLNGYSSISGSLASTATVQVDSGGTFQPVVSTGSLTLAGGVNFNGGTVNILGNGTTLSGAMSVGANGGIITLTTTSTGSTQNVFSGAITGGGTLNVENISTANFANALVFSGNNGGFSGTFAVDAATGTSSTRFATLSSATAGSAAATFAVSASNTLKIAGVAVSLGNLTGAGTVNTSTGTGTINVGGLGADGTFSGVISGSTNVAKVGGGTWTLTGVSNTFTGTTNVSAGTLLISNATGSATGTGNVTLNGGTFATGATGIITGNLLAGSGAHTIAPGGVGSVGTLVVGGLTTNGNTTINFDLGSTNVGTGTDGNAIDGGGDLFNIGSGTVSIGSGTTLAFNTSITTAGTDYRLFGGTVSGLALGSFALPTAPAGTTYSLSNSVDAGYVDLLVIGSRTLTWDGNGDGTTWDTAKLNFTNGSADVAFNGPGDTVLFNDQNNNHYGVTIPALVTPASTTITTANTYTFSGNGGIGGIGGLTVNGTGRVVMGTSNSYGGATTVTAGTLAVGNASALGATNAPLLVNGGTVDLAGFAVTTGTLNLTAGSVVDTVGTGSLAAAAFNVSAGSIGASLTGPGTLTKLTASTFALTTSNSYTGGTNVSAGTLTVGNAAALGSAAGNLLVAGGTLNLNGFSPTVGTFTLTAGSITDSTSTGATLAATTAFNVSAGTLGVTLTGPGVLNKIGAGTYALTGTNSFTGGTNVVAGTLTIVNPAALGPTTNTLTVSGGTLDQGGNSLTVGVVTLNGGTITDNTSSTTTLTGTAYNLNGGTVNVPLTGPAGLTEFGSGVVTLNAANTYAGGTNVGSGTLIVNGNQSGVTGGWSVGPTSLYNATANLASGSTVVSPGPIQIGSTGGGTGTETLNVAGNATNGGLLYVGRSAIMNVSGGGTWNQTGPAAIVSQGGYGAYVTVATGGTFNYAGPATFNFSGGTNTAGVATLAVAGGTFNTSQGLVATTPTANGNYGALLALSAGGTVRLTANVPSLTSIASNALPIFNVSIGTGGGTVDTNGYSTAIATTVIGAGTLTKAGAGTLALNAASNYSGGTVVNGGTLQANGALTGAVTSSATGTGLVTVNSGATLAGNGGTGAVTVASGGFITAGSGRTTTDTIATLTTTAQTWSAGGTYVAKVAAIDPTSANNVNDQLVMSGLTVASGFAVSLLNTTGATLTFAGPNTDTSGTLTGATPGSYVVIAKDAEGGASPFNSSSTVAALNLTFTHTGFAPATTGDKIQLAGVSDGSGFDLIAEESTAATPEPTSLLLAALAAAPLTLGRRRRKSVGR